MTTDADATRIVRSWLEDGRTVLPDRVLDAVLDQLPSTPQLRGWWPARTLRDANAFARLSLAAAAVIAVVLVGVAVLPGPSGVIAPAASPTPTPSASPSVRLLPRSGALEAGTYAIPVGSMTPVRFTLTVPAGWATDNAGFISKGRSRTDNEDPDSFFNGRVFLVTWRVTHVYSDICHDRALVSAGTTADSLLAALVAQTGRTIAGPTGTTLGSAAAQRVVMTVPLQIDPAACEDGIIRFWPDPGPDETGGLCCGAPGSTDVVDVVDAGGLQPLVVVARHQPDSTTADLAELDAIVASIRIDRPSSSSGPGPSFSPTPPPAPAP